MKHLLSLTLLLLIYSFSQASLVIVNGLSHEHSVQAGVSSMGSIIIKNTSKRPRRARIYKTDVVHNCDGQTTFIQGTGRSRCNSDWTLISDNEIIIPSQQSYTLTYELSPGLDIDASGSYWGVIMVEEIKELDTIAPERGVTVTSLIRYAIQIISNFNAEPVKDLEFIGVDIDTTKDLNIIVVSVSNKGNFLLKPIMVLELYNDDGEQVYRTEIPYQKVYPGFCKLFELSINEVDEGTYNGILVADCGDENIYGINLEIDVPAPKSRK